MGRRGSAEASVDIFRTQNAGWGTSSFFLSSSLFNFVDLWLGTGLRIGPTSRFVEKGTPLGIYAGELLSTTEAERRNSVYNKIGRTYLFQLDHWTLKERFGEDYEAEYEIDAFSYGKLVVFPLFSFPSFFRFDSIRFAS